VFQRMRASKLNTDSRLAETSAGKQPELAESPVTVSTVPSRCPRRRTGRRFGTSPTLTFAAYIAIAGARGSMSAPAAAAAVREGNSACCDEKRRLLTLERGLRESLTARRRHHSSRIEIAELRRFNSRRRGGDKIAGPDAGPKRRAM